MGGYWYMASKSLKTKSDGRVFYYMELVLADGSVWIPYVESYYTWGAPRFCVAKVYINRGEWMPVFMPIGRWRQIRTHQSLAFSGLIDVVSNGLCYLGDIIERWD